MFDPKDRKTISTGIVNATAGPKKKIGGASTLSIFPPNQCSRAASISKNGHLAIGVNNGEVHIYETKNLQMPIKTLSEPKEWIEAIAFSPDDNFLAVGSHDNNIYIYDVFYFVL